MKQTNFKCINIFSLPNKICFREKSLLDASTKFTVKQFRYVFYGFEENLFVVSLGSLTSFVGIGPILQSPVVNPQAYKKRECSVI